MSAKRLLSDIVSFTPATTTTFTQLPAPASTAPRSSACPRAIPAPSTDQGLLVHDMLRKIHADGRMPRRRARRRRARRARHRHRPTVREIVARHARRCPSRDVDGAAHEVRRRPLPPSPATDVHGHRAHRRGVDPRRHARRTRLQDGRPLRRHGRRRSPPPTCRLTSRPRRPQSRGLRLRLRYEYLQPEVDEDPEPWELDDEDIGRDRGRASGRGRTHVEAGGMARRRRRSTCVARVAYRSICRDSAAPGEPAWPVLSIDAPGADR